MDFTRSSGAATWEARVQGFWHGSESPQPRASASLRSWWPRLGAAGFLGLPLPRELGGADASYEECAAAMTALGHYCPDNGLAFSVSTHLWACALPLYRFGSEEQRAEHIPQLTSGAGIGALAMTEPTAGSDIQGIQATARRVGRDYVLRGQKIYITNLPDADLILAFAKDCESQRIMAFLLRAGTPGLVLVPPYDKLGLDSTPFGGLTLTDCRVPWQDVVAGPGKGQFVFNFAMEMERAYTFAACLGQAERVLDLSIARARSRKVTGRRIADHQAICDPIVDRKVTLELAALLLQKITWLHDSGRSAYRESAIFKLVVSECLRQATLDALQVHGAHGYTEESGIPREIRDALACTIYSGTSQVQRRLLARFIGL